MLVSCGEFRASLKAFEASTMHAIANKIVDNNELIMKESVFYPLVQEIRLARGFVVNETPDSTLLAPAGPSNFKEPSGSSKMKLKKPTVIKRVAAKQADFYVTQKANIGKRTLLSEELETKPFKKRLLNAEAHLDVGLEDFKLGYADSSPLKNLITKKKGSHRRDGSTKGRFNKKGTKMTMSIATLGGKSQNEKNELCDSSEEAEVAGHNMPPPPP